ncbi:exodeoxyribonuclease VII small subunit [Leifsonia sp. Root227]|nr:exodeoxyribonuclease VII small subunit [Leifsonia sp. Root227]
MDAMPPTESTSSDDALGSDPLASLSYEEARDELIRVVGQLEQGSSTLEDSIALWERGEALARHCEEWLIGAKARLDAARAGAGASAGVGAGTGSTDAE